MKLILLDRDGVINEDRRDYVKNRNELRLLPGAGEAIATLNAAQIKIAVVTNQSCVGKGIMTAEDVDHIHALLQQDLKPYNAHIDRFYWCGDNTQTHRRKPSPGMLEEALNDFNATPTETPLVGDALRDLQAAATLGCPRYLVRTGQGLEHLAAGLPETLQPVTVCDDLHDAVKRILEK